MLCYTACTMLAVIVKERHPKGSMRTLFLNPPSFEGFDGGAGSRWPASREIESYWYPVWLCYPAGMLEDSKVVDAPPHKISIEQTVAMANDFELLVLFTSSPGFHVDVKIAEMMKDVNPKMKVAFVGPPVTIEPEKSLNASKAIDFVVRREFDHQIANYAKGTPLSELPGVSYWKDGEIVHNPEGGVIENLDELPWVTKVYKRDLDFRRYNVPFLLNPFISFYTTRGCPAMCTFCLWPQTHSGHRWRLRSSDDVATECKYALENFPGLKEIFFDDDTFNYRKARTIELSNKLGPLNFTWSCTSRVTTDYDTLKAMKDAGCRLLIVGYESGDEQILKNIKKGATIDMAHALHRELPQAGLGDPRRFHRRPAGRNARDSAQDHRFRQEAGRRDHSGFARPCLPRHRVLRARQSQRPGEHRRHGRCRRPSAAQRRLSGLRSRRAGGVGGALLLRILLPSQSRLARGDQGHSRTTIFRGCTKKRANICSSAPSASSSSRNRKSRHRALQGAEESAS